MSENDFSEKAIIRRIERKKRYAENLGKSGGSVISGSIKKLKQLF